MKLVILDWSTMCRENDLSAESFRQFGDVCCYPLTSPEETAERIGDAEIVLCNKVKITREIMDSCPNLRYIGLFATGYNNVDVKYAAEKGIAVCNAGQYSTKAVAQQVFAYILDYANRVRDYDSAVKSGEWETSPCFSYFPLPTMELEGKNLSIVGFGSIGRRVAELGSAFGMNVIVSTRTMPSDCGYEVTDLETAVKKADFLTFHCPLTEKTKGMVNAELLKLMKPSAVVINTSRGAVVNEADLCAALNGGQLARAYLDVLETEPMSPETPLKSAKSCVITPHTAWAPFETRTRLLHIVLDNIAAWLSGSPKNKVT